MGQGDPNASSSRAEAASKLPGCSCGDGLPGEGHADGCSNAWKMSSSAATACRRRQKNFECLQGNDRNAALRQKSFQVADASCQCSVKLLHPSTPHCRFSLIS